MPVYQGDYPGTWRIIVWSNGHRTQRRFRGTRDAAERLCAELTPPRQPRARLPRVEPRADRLKRCCLCADWLPLSCFSLDRRLADGREPRCRACRSEYRAGIRSASRGYHRASVGAHADATAQRRGSP